MKRRDVMAGAGLTVLGMTVSATTDPAAAQDQQTSDIRFNNIAISVGDIERSAAWYSEIFGFRIASRSFFKPVSAQVAFLEKGDLRLELLQVEGTRKIPDLYVAPPTHLKTLGYKAIVFDVADLPGFSERLKAKSVEILWADQPLTDDGLRSTLIRDPDGNLINIFNRR
jgi:catechol 2,3-dioxygenase-like lactoylglutathione lyase family enzyme